MSDETPRLLLPSAGRKAALMRELERHFRVYPCGFAPQESAAACLSGRGRFVEQPSNLDDQEYVRWLVETCKRIGINVVLPVRDGDMPRLELARETLTEHGIRLILSPRATWEACNDKQLMYDRLNGVLNVPVTVPADDWKSFPYFPLFAKERYGAGSRVAQKVWTPEELGAMIVHHRDLVIQPIIGKREFTVDMFFAHDAKLAQFVVRERISTSEGQMDRGRVVKPNANMATAVSKLARALTFIGPVNAQFMENDMVDGDYWLTDVNCRFGGGTPLSIAAGCDFVKYLYVLHTGGEIVPDAPSVGTTAVAFISYVFRRP